MDDAQQTLKRPVRYSGIALHTGVRAHVTLNPAPANAGVVIRRTDLAGAPPVRAHASQVIDVMRATTIANGPARVHTVEHVLAALHALGVDNAAIDMDGPEPPIADGSSAPYVALIQEAGLVAQDAPRRYFEVKEPIFIERGESKMVLLPDPQYRISCTVKYNATILDTQYLSLTVTPETFARDLSLARTFCLYEEIAPLMSKGLIRGGSLDNAVVMKDGAIISKDGLRYNDEFVRHKMLDIVGDLSLIGCRLRAQVIAIKPGHPLNVTMAQALCEHLTAAGLA